MYLLLYFLFVHLSFSNPFSGFHLFLLFLDLSLCFFSLSHHFILSVFLSFIFHPTSLSIYYLSVFMVVFEFLFRKFFTKVTFQYQYRFGRRDRFPTPDRVPRRHQRRRRRRVCRHRLRRPRPAVNFIKLYFCVTDDHSE